MFARKSDKPQNRIDSLIGAGTRVDGDVTFTGGLRVDGRSGAMSPRRRARRARSS